jgi:acetyl esterase/lipase
LDFLARVEPELRGQLLRTMELDFEARTLEDLIAQRAQTVALWTGLLGETPWTVPSEDLAIPRRQSNEPLRVRLYRPPTMADAAAVLVWVHGGGMIGGSLDADDRHCARYALEVGCAVVSVDYRLAPEHPFPAAIDDVCATVEWLVAHAAHLRVDPNRIAIGGSSAGGGLAAGAAIALLQAGGPSLRFQLLVRPMLDDRAATPSAREFSGTPGWNRELNAIGWSAYLGTDHGVDLPPAAAPSRATVAELRGLPPAMIQVGELEVFRDEAVAYAAALLAARVPTELHVYPGAYHGWDTIAPDAAISRRSISERMDALRRALGTNDPLPVRRG